MRAKDLIGMAAKRTQPVKESYGEDYSYNDGTFILGYTHGGVK